jgi:hypothetical protein
MLASNPEAGDLIKGSGGLRKVLRRIVEAWEE